jgi:hypothetical protein
LISEKVDEAKDSFENYAEDIKNGANQKRKKIFY